jgi:HB1, ASXL, restriction endonuclease HTH domain
MSKKKTTTKPEAARPSVIPIMKSRSGKKAKGKAGVDQATATPTATDLPAPSAGHESAPAATEQPTDVASETLPIDTSEATNDVNQVQAPAAETPPASAAKGKKKGKAKQEPKPKKMSCLDAGAQILEDAGTAMTTSEMIEAMGKKKLWSSPNGQTPAATLYSAILREINTKGKDARFTKTERGKFSVK